MIPHKFYVKVLLYSSPQLWMYFTVASILAISRYRLKELTSLELIEESLVKHQTIDTIIVLIFLQFYLLQFSHKHRSHLEIKVAERNFKLSRLILLQQLYYLLPPYKKYFTTSNSSPTPPQNGCQFHN